MPVLSITAMGGSEDHGLPTLWQVARNHGTEH
jgi:hypothetical protein